MKRDKAREYHLRSKYGITELQYNKILQDQQGCCAVCRRRASTFKVHLAVDHDHKTGEIFGLLCTHCNRYVIGRIRNPELFENAAAYLRGGTGFFVPKKSKKRIKRSKRKNKK
jgi:hypothetical protein